MIFPVWDRRPPPSCAAAKRPWFFPIRDSVVEQLVGAGTRWWWPVRELCGDPELRKLIERCSGDVPANVSYLRRVDVMLWMYGKQRQATAD